MQPQGWSMADAGPSTRRSRKWLAAGAACAVLLTAGAYLAERRLSPTLGFRQTFVDASQPGAAPRFERITRDVDLGFLDADPALPRREFRVSWEGIWHRDRTQWIDLYAGGDDAVTIKIDGRVVIERNPAVGMGTERVRFELPAGDHHVVVEYAQDGGDFGLNISTGPAGDFPHPFARERVFPSTPGRRTLATIGWLSWLRTAAVAAWVLLAVWWAAMIWGRRGVSLIRHAWRGWLARHRANWRQWRMAPDGPSDASVRPARSQQPAIVFLFVLTALAGLASFGRFYDPKTGFTPLILFGSKFDGRALPSVRAVPHYVYENSAGYDGQFYAQLAVDPFPGSPDVAKAIDTPSVRMRRMLFSWTAFVLGLGRPAWVLQVYAVQNIVVWLLLALLLCRWLPPVSVRHWLAWSSCLFAYGLIFSVRYSLTDGPSLLLIALAIASAERGHRLLASLILGIAGLAREANVLAAPGCFPSLSSGRRLWVQRAIMALLMVAPPMLWLMYLRSLLGPEVVSGGGSFEPPFAGIFTQFGVVIREYRFEGWSLPVTASTVAILSLGVQVAYLAWRMAWRAAWWRAALPYVLLAALLSWPVWTGTPGAFTRVLLPITVAFNVLLPDSRRFWPIFILGDLSVVLSVTLLFAGLPR